MRWWYRDTLYVSQLAKGVTARAATFILLLLFHTPTLHNRKTLTHNMRIILRSPLTFTTRVHRPGLQRHRSPPVGVHTCRLFCVLCIQDSISGHRVYRLLPSRQRKTYLTEATLSSVKRFAAPRLLIEQDNQSLNINKNVANKNQFVSKYLISFPSRIHSRN